VPPETFSSFFFKEQTERGIVATKISVSSLGTQREAWSVLLKLAPGEKYLDNGMMYTKIEDMNISGLPAVRYSAQPISGMPSIPPYTYRDQAMIEKKENVFTFSLVTDSIAQEKDIDAFNQILSTFRFIEPITIPKVGFISGQSDTITQIPEPGLVTSITIDFAKCSRGSDRVLFGLGSTHFAFEGIKNADCIFYYGGEIENPNWDGFLSHKCSVPTSLNEQTYSVTNYGIEMETLKPYCTAL